MPDPKSCARLETTISSNAADRSAALLRYAVAARGPVLPDAETWPEWLWLAELERIVPLLFHLVDSIPTDLTDEQRRQLREAQGSVLSRSVRLEHHLIGVSGLLGAHGIPSLVLKGAATAHLDYPDPSWREFHDIDLLIHAADRDESIALLATAGWVQGYALPGGHEDFTHAVTLVRERAELDLHQRTAHRALGLRVPTQDLFDHATSYEIAGSPLGVLDPVDRLIHGAVHAVASRAPYRHLSSVADVLSLADLRRHLAADALVRAERWRVRPIVERAVRDAYAMAQLDLPEEWVRAMELRIRHRDRLVDLAYLSPVRRPVTEELAYLRLLDGWGARWRYARGHFSIGADYASQHGRSGARAQAKYLISKLRSRSS